MHNSLCIFQGTSLNYEIYLFCKITSAIFSASMYTVDCGCPGTANGDAELSTTRNP